jgi:hypothetical protein
LNIGNSPPHREERQKRNFCLLIYLQLKGSVRWQNGRGRKGMKVWLSAEGKAATIALLASVTFLQRLSSNLFEDLQKRLQVLVLFATE